MSILNTQHTYTYYLLYNLKYFKKSQIYVMCIKPSRFDDKYKIITDHKAELR
jgi:hypothetical protein